MPKRELHLGLGNSRLALMLSWMLAATPALGHVQVLVPREHQRQVAPAGVCRLDLRLQQRTRSPEGKKVKAELGGVLWIRCADMK